MDKKVSIVKVDSRHYRKIAQNNWGLTKEQMQGMHVHHRIPVSKGGANDPCNLYVCSPSFHRWVWHNGEQFIEWASEGGKLGGRAQPREVKVQNALKGIAKSTREQRSSAGKLGAAVTNSKMSVETKRKLAQQMREKTDRSVLVAAGLKCRDESLGMFGMSAEDRHNANVKGGRSGGAIAVERRVGVHAMSKEEKAEAARKAVKNRSHEDSVKAGIISATTMWEDPCHPELGVHNAGNLAQKQRSMGLPHGKENRVKCKK